MSTSELHKQVAQKSVFSTGVALGPLPQLILLAIWGILLFFWLHHAACEVLVPRPGIEPASPAVETRSPSHCTAKEFLMGYPLWPTDRIGKKPHLVHGWVNMVCEGKLKMMTVALPSWDWAWKTVTKNNFLKGQSSGQCTWWAILCIRSGQKLKYIWTWG